MPESTRINLLHEPVFRVRTAGEAVDECSLAEVLGRLGNEEPLEFMGLQAHQSPAWHAFLCQLGAIALHAAKRSEVRDLTAEDWRRMLLSLTDGASEPWCLFVADLAKPAFMQPPVPEGALSAWKNETEQPDFIDLLVTSKNHDIKSRRADCPRPEHWVFALISKQTTDGYPGKTYYGVARINGAYGNRPCIAAASSERNDARFIRDTRLLLDLRDDIASRFSFSHSGGHTLLWTVPWDGGTSLPLGECDPLFIEICRRIRLNLRDSRFFAAFIGSKMQRVQASAAYGNIGDPWTPIRRANGWALSAKNLDYPLLQDVLFGQNFEPSVASEIRAEDGESPVFVARVLARGQGKTEGYYERAIPCPPKARRIFGTAGGRSSLGSVARQRVELVATIRNGVLKPALLCLFQGAPEKLDFDDRRPDSFVRRLENRVDREFFTALFDDVDQDPGEAMRAWVDRVLGFAREILDDAIRSAPYPSMRRYKAIAAAEAVFHGAARKKFPDNFARPENGGLPNGNPAGAN